VGSGLAASGICLRLQASACARIAASNFSADSATEAACSKNSARRAKKLSDLTKFSLAPPANWAIVSDMAKHDLDLSLLFHALADPTRRSILTRLAETPARVTDLAGPTGLRLPTVMRHLSVLEEAGLITTSKDGRIRTCAIVPEALDPVRTWLDEQRAIWETRLDRLDAFVMNVMKEREE
jgi:DNA-binding transcriptional ArsR family regulator